MRYLTQYAGQKNQTQDQALDKTTQPHRDANVERLAARVYAAFRTKDPLETRKSTKSRRPLPSSSTISRPPEMYVWIAKLIQDCRDTAQTIYISRKLIFGFALTFALSEAPFTLEMSYNFGEYSQEQPTTKVARWLRSYSKVLHPEYPDDSDPLMMGELMGQRPCDWLQSPVKLIAQLTTGFACTHDSNVWHSSLLVLALAPLVRQVLSSRQIVLAYIIGGFLALNIEGAIRHFTDPNARLPAEQLQDLLNKIPPRLFDRPYRMFLLDSQVLELREMQKEATEMMGSAPEEEIQKILENIKDKKEKIESLHKLGPIISYTGVSIGTSCALMCMETIASLAIPKSPWRFLVRVYLLHTLNIDLVRLASGRSNGINALGHVSGNLAGLALWFGWLRWIRKLPAPRLGMYTGGIILVPWVIEFFDLWKKDEPDN